MVSSASNVETVEGSDLYPAKYSGLDGPYGVNLSNADPGIVLSTADYSNLNEKDQALLAEVISERAALPPRPRGSKEDCLKAISAHNRYAARLRLLASISSMNASARTAATTTVGSHKEG
jgi:hypothetical protein